MVVNDETNSININATIHLMKFWVEKQGLDDYLGSRSKWVTVNTKVVIDYVLNYIN